MWYIHAIELINLAIKNDVLKEKDGGAFVYRNNSDTSPEGWYLEDKDTIAYELMEDEEGQKLLIEALKDKNIEFKPTDFSWLTVFLDKASQSN